MRKRLSALIFDKLECLANFSIEYAAFVYCQSLTSVTIPSSVNHIKVSAFHGCNKLQTIYNQNPTPQSLGKDVFYEVPRDVVVYIPKGSLDKYTEAKGWNYFTDFREMGTSGVDETVTDTEVPVDAYNLQGVEVLRGAAASELSKLPAGIYIVRQGKSVKKMIVK
ncbi:MAG: leucine-rich repeat domain-containing protein [Muribaculaceae bacterium]|nr:leucine-rich repeat domain-containing protein [Muribaculaceae bacterium]